MEDTKPRTIEFTSEDFCFVDPAPTARALRDSVIRVQLLRLAMRGMRAKDAMRAVGCSEAVARRHYADREFQREVHRRISKAFADSDTQFMYEQKNLGDLIEGQAYSSFHELVKMLDGEYGTLRPETRMKIHQDFLNRTADSRQQAAVVHTWDADALRIAAKTATEMDTSMSTPSKATVEGRVVSIGGGRRTGT